MDNLMLDVKNDLTTRVVVFSRGKPEKVHPFYVTDESYIACTHRVTANGVRLPIFFTTRGFAIVFMSYEETRKEYEKLKHMNTATFDFVDMTLVRYINAIYSEWKLKKYNYVEKELMDPLGLFITCIIVSIVLYFIPRCMDIW